MKKTNLHFVKSKRILLAIALANTYVCGEISAINEDTPGLSFEMGFPESFTDDQLGVWKRYYGFFGAEDFGAENISNDISNLFYLQKRTVGQLGDEDGNGWVQYGKAKSSQVEFTDSFTYKAYCFGKEIGEVTYKPGATVKLPAYIDYDGESYELGQYAEYTYPTEVVQFSQGSFEIIDKRTLDPMVRNGCVSSYPFYTMPAPENLEQGQKVVRIGSVDETEMFYNYSVPQGYMRRAMAERMVYSFEVKENSTLLSCQHAAFLEEPKNHSLQEDDHFGDEHPSANISVTLRSANGDVIKPMCGEFQLDMNADVSQFSTIDKNCSKIGALVSYKDWSNYLYDLRDHVGEVVTIDVSVHDCLIRLAVCDNCGTPHASADYYTDENGTLRIKQCGNKGTFQTGSYLVPDLGKSVTGTPYTFLSGCGRENAPCRLVPMAGGHRAYCYFTAFTKKLEMVVDSSSASDTITITAPTGFSRYEWKTGTAPFVSEDGKSNVAKLLRSDIQENTDYSCVMFGDDENCTKIIGTVQLFKDGSGVVDELGERVVSYPNPVKDALIVKGYVNLPYTIFSMRGEAVSQGLMAGEKIDLSSLTTGGYWLKISREDGKTDYLKVIKE